MIDFSGHQRYLLSFRCPVCQSLLQTRLNNFIWSDTSLSKASERSSKRSLSLTSLHFPSLTLVVRVQCVLDEAEHGLLSLHSPISAKELVNEKPISSDLVYLSKYQGTPSPILCCRWRPFIVV